MHAEVIHFYVMTQLFNCLKKSLTSITNLRSAVQKKSLDKIEEVSWFLGYIPFTELEEAWCVEEQACIMLIRTCRMIVNIEKWIKYKPLRVSFIVRVLVNRVLSRTLLTLDLWHLSDLLQILLELKHYRSWCIISLT